MPQSFCRVLVHLMFATKYRRRVLTPEIRRELHPYLAQVVRNTDCLCLEVGGVEDHVHVLLGLSRVHPISEIAEIIKKSSSKAMPHFRFGTPIQTESSAIFATRNGTIDKGP